MSCFAIPYGSRQLQIEIPANNFFEYLEPNRVHFPADEAATLAAAIDNPIGSGPLADLVRPDDRVCLICDDISRPTPIAKILPLVLDRLNAAGVPDGHIFAVMALGSHRPMTEAEIGRKVGRGIRERIPVYNSEFRDRGKLVDLGAAPGGVRIWADRRVTEADVRIGLGSIVPHTTVGWSGGGKIIYPGVTGEETVAAFHLQHGLVTWNMWGSEHSPVRESMERWVDTVGLHFIVNVVCKPDGRIYRAVAGHYIAAHRAGVGFAKELFAVKARSKVEIAIVSSHPADQDFWQAGKGMASGDFLLVDGGTLILVTPCPEGVGPHPDFMALAGDDRIESLLAEGADLGRHGDPLAIPVAVTTGRIRRRIRVALVSEGITIDQAGQAGFRKYETVSEALAAALAHHGPQARVSVLPYGGEVFPIAG